MAMEAPLIAADILQWLHDQAVRIDSPTVLIEELGKRLNNIGVPAERITTGIAILHPNVRAESVIWLAGSNQTELRRFMESPDLDAAYQRSPLRVVFVEKRSVRFRIPPQAEANEYNLTDDLRKDGFKDYIALPMPFSDGTTKSLTFATRAEEGFTEAHIRVFETISRPLGLLCELQTLKRTARTLLETYVGRRAGGRVLDGSIKRGDGETISAVVGFADLRRFTELSNELPASELIELLNTYFSAIAVPVEAHGGEVLKFIGDEVMSIFPYFCDETAQEAARQALLASHESVNLMAKLTKKHADGRPKVRAGIALHAGDVFFGNVGSETRLDFTVIGPTVNLASRIAGLSRDLHKDILVSKSIADIIGCEGGYLGNYQVKGFSEPVSVFEPHCDFISPDGALCTESAAFLALENN